MRKQKQYLTRTMSIYELNMGYAGLLTAGGLIGYLKKSSVDSLVFGAGSGALVAGFTHFGWPYRTAAVTAISGYLSYVMGNKFLDSNKFMPAGLIALTSVITCLAQLREWYLTGSPH